MYATCATSRRHRFATAAWKLPHNRFLHPPGGSKACMRADVGYLFQTRLTHLQCSPAACAGSFQTGRWQPLLQNFLLRLGPPLVPEAWTSSWPQARPIEQSPAITLSFLISSRSPTIDQTQEQQHSLTQHRLVVWGDMFPTNHYPMASQMSGFTTEDLPNMRQYKRVHEQHVLSILQGAHLWPLPAWRHGSPPTNQEGFSPFCKPSSPRTAYHLEVLLL
jgi:hypothetical protein